MHIPNLNSLRRGSGRRGAGRGRATATGAECGHGAGLSTQDRIVQSTDNDAAASRLSAVAVGYLEDPFTNLLNHGGKVEKRLPLMNRGTYVRTTAIDRLVGAFMGHDEKKVRQIISLGAGSDTRFFRLKQKYRDVSLIYHEFDFPINTALKMQQMQQPPFVQSVERHCGVDMSQNSFKSLNDDGAESLGFHAGNAHYHLHPLDLRTLTRFRRDGSAVEQDVSRLGISANVPTLLLSECCLIYLPPEDADSVLSYFTSAFHPETALGVIIYEPIRPHDAFGRTMVANLTARGIHLQTLNAHDSLAAQKERLRKHGFGSRQGSEGGGAAAADVDFIWQRWIEDREKARVENLEWMDEVEEWRLLARHYCIAWGWKTDADADADVDHVEDSVFEDWAHLPVQDEEA